MVKPLSEREQLVLFRALPGVDLAPRDAQDLMAYPFFSLAKSRRTVPIHFEAGGVSLTVEGVPEHGIATIWDADVLIWAASQIVQARDEGLRPSRLMLATPYEILRFARRGTGRTDYRMLKAALDRLQSTTVATSIRQPTGKRLHRFSWINEWKEHVRPHGSRNGCSGGIELILADWFFSGVMDNALVLTLDPAYFRLSGGIERWLYRLVRKHGGRQAQGWRFDLRHLHLKSGSLQRYTDFAVQLRRLVRRQALPGYWLVLERIDSTDWLRFHRWPRGTPASDLSTPGGENPVHKLCPDSGNRPHGIRGITRKGLGYGGTYPGPMGAVLTPIFDGLENSREPVHACTLNGKCQEVCPVDIPLPTLLRGWRDRSWREGLEPATMRAGLGVFAFMASRPWLYHLSASIAVRAMRLFNRGGWIRGMPGIGAWTAHRDFPAPAKRTFMAMVRDGTQERP